MVIEAVHRAADNGKYHVYEEKGIRRVTKEEYEASGPRASAIPILVFAQ